jgi:hypothetical protein
MKFYHKGGTIDINKKALAAYSDDDLQAFAEANGIDEEDTVKLREKVGEAEQTDGAQTMTNQSVNKTKRK